MCYRYRLFFLLFTLCLLASVTGCVDAEQAQTTAQQGATMSTQLMTIAPVEYAPALGILASGLTLVGAIFGFVKERRRAEQMKAAILAKADQIDKLALSAAAQSENPGNVVTKFMKANTKMADRPTTKALNVFDAVRKGLM